MAIGKFFGKIESQKITVIPMKRYTKKNKIPIMRRNRSLGDFFLKLYK